MKKQFYIYVHCRPSGEPFYVGKGQGIRGYSFNKSSGNRHYKNIINKYGAENILVCVRICKSEYQAHQHEIWMIAWCLAQGSRLTNKTTGGDGVSGWNPSDKTRATWRTQRKGKQLGNQHALGNKHTPAWSAHISALGRGRIWTEEHRVNHAVAMVASNSERVWSVEMRAAAARGSLGNTNASGKRTVEQCARNSAAQKAWRKKASQL